MKDENEDEAKEIKKGNKIQWKRHSEERQGESDAVAGYRTWFGS